MIYIEMRKQAGKNLTGTHTFLQCSYANIDTIASFRKTTLTDSSTTFQNKAQNNEREGAKNCE